MDILHELPLDQWPVLQTKLKRMWPLNIPGYYALHLNLIKPKVREAFDFKVYTPYGHIENGFIATMNIKATECCILFSITADTSKIEEAIIKTKLIDWSKTVFIDLITSLTLKSIGRVNEVMKFNKYEVAMAKMYLLDRSTELFTDLRLPENSYSAPVKLEDITRVDDTWTYKHSTSHFYFTTLASNGLSYGLYSNDHKLLAWVFINEYNFLCHLFCEEGYRRKGCAEYVMKWAVNGQLKHGNDVYAYVADGNKKPLALFKKLGFVPVDDSAFINVQKSPGS